MRRREAGALVLRGYRDQAVWGARVGSLPIRFRQSAALRLFRKQRSDMRSSSWSER